MYRNCHWNPVILDEQAGGAAELSNDIRAAVKAGDAKARLAVDMFILAIVNHVVRFLEKEAE